MPTRTSYDAVIVGGGHNGLVAAAYLARAGLGVLVLERLGHTGGAAVSTRAFPGVDARLSRYAYLVSLLPDRIVRELGLRFAVRGRRIASYTPAVRCGRATGLLVDASDKARTRESFARLTGSDREYRAWRDFYAMARRTAQRVAPTLTGPLPTAAELERTVGDAEAWEAFFVRPLGEVIERRFSDDLVRGVVLTDALIGTDTSAHDPELRQNRCFLHHVIGNGTGDWNVPVGGMGTLTDALAEAARAAGAELATRHEVTAVATDGRTAEVTFRRGGPGNGGEGRVGSGDAGEGREGRVSARYVLANAAPYVLSRLLGEPASGPAPEGSQLKVNMLLRRLPRLRDRAVAPKDAFAGTFHIAEAYSQLEAAARRVADGSLPEVQPSEIYCHSLTDPSVLSPALAERGFHTLTLFGLHTPARLLDTPQATARAVDAALARLDGHLEEPVRSCIAEDGDGRPCIEARSPRDLERELAMPGGHIFHRDLAFPHGPGGGWGVETAHPNVLVCGAGAVRGGGVSGIPGHNAAMAVLERLGR